MFRKLGVGLLAAAMGLSLSLPARAGFLDTQLTAGTINVFEDNSREAFIDLDNSNGVSVGDVLIGYIRVDNKSAPNAVNYNNNIYAIFSQQVVGFAAFGPISFVVFAPTVTAGLTLSDVIGGAPATGIVAVYSDAAGMPDLITGSAGGTLAADFAAITGSGDLELIAGFGAAGDFLNAIGTIAVTADDNSATGILQLQGGETAANFTAGLTILVNNTSFLFGLVDATNLLTGLPTLHQLAISGGTATGGSDDPFFGDWADASGFGAFNQCQTQAAPAVNLPCGFRDNADFSVNPFLVPEPGSLALLGLGLFGLAFGVRRRKVVA